jgi:hypothetical protein
MKINEEYLIAVDRSEQINAWVYINGTIPCQSCSIVFIVNIALQGNDQRIHGINEEKINLIVSALVNLVKRS